ncbi:hepatocellular carcinomaassociated antigen 59, putative [Acanthamoeba castellanii str. Neff]|uniref:Hepatocellular carcinomaassociated antigen 59, putative n=1 Tax=Acanthamoeba castellanii (strain ATCC 30010 / Neff) TaxID=1257118 RepID=L8GZA6_ACACF|nr:hepatocellular carcinomaassociated antigen 59, putative [Acanthamoeba castellanii str. Neff]ELR18335.1 hepatocellular carcinomaassociated antigen 59, putative [Acanthamoeba castellanii str. Neff]
MSQEAEEQIVVAFKKPGAGRKQKARLRKKIVEDEPETEADQEAETEEGEDDAPLGLMLRETRKLQRERERVKGCEAAATSTEVLQKIATSSFVRPVANDDDDKETHLLESTFTVQAEQDVVNPLLENYIEARLREFRETRAKEAIEKAKAERGVDWRDKEETTEKEFDLREEERKLYEIPEHLKVSETMRSDDQVSEAWLTGIQEVELPIEYKLKNIEATEDAKRLLLKRKEGPKPPPQPDAYNTRFGRPSTQTQIVRRDRNAHRDSNRDRNNDGQQQGGWRGDHHRGKKSEQATDDIAFERFKKRFRR